MLVVPHFVGGFLKVKANDLDLLDLTPQTPHLSVPSLSFFNFSHFVFNCSKQGKSYGQIMMKSYIPLRVTVLFTSILIDSWNNTW